MFTSGSDPFVQALKSVNYLVVRLPKADMSPLQILSRSGNSLVRLGDIGTVMTAGTQPLPTVQHGAPTANVNGSRTGNMKIGLGLSLLGNIIGAVGGSKIGFDGNYANASVATFEFQNVTEEKVGIDKLDQFLGAADINPASVAIGSLLDSDRVYVLTSVLKSDTFVFDAQSSHAGEFSLDVPVIQEAVGGNVKVTPVGGSKTKLAYTGKIPLAFAFQAIQLFFDDGKFTSFKPAENVAAAFQPTAKQDFDGADYLTIQETFAPVRL